MDIVFFILEWSQRLFIAGEVDRESTNSFAKASANPINMFGLTWFATG